MSCVRELQLIGLASFIQADPLVAWRGLVPLPWSTDNFSSLNRAPTGRPEWWRFNSKIILLTSHRGTGFLARLVFLSLRICGLEFDCWSLDNWIWSQENWVPKFGRFAFLESLETWTWAWFLVLWQLNIEIGRIGCPQNRPKRCIIVVVDLNKDLIWSRSCGGGKWGLLRALSEVKVDDDMHCRLDSSRFDIILAERLPGSLQLSSWTMRCYLHLRLQTKRTKASPISNLQWLHQEVKLWTSANLQKTSCLFGLFQLLTKLTSQPKFENLSHRCS